MNFVEVFYTEAAGRPETCVKTRPDEAVPKTSFHVVYVGRADEGCA